MYKCAKCNLFSAPCESCNKIVSKTRDKTYKYIDKNGDEQTAYGYETVKEIMICGKCKKALDETKKA